MMKVAILGSTGSIGTSALDVIAKYPEQYDVVGLAAGNNTALLQEQVRRFQPKLVSVSSSSGAGRIQTCGNTRVLSGEAAAQTVAAMPEADTVIAAISGSAGLFPTLAAVRSGKTVALANKESLVMAGEIIVDAARKSGSEIIPVDSEHSAVFQLLEGRNRADVKNIILTASGGPFLGAGREDLKSVTPAEALNHPRWKMGNKVTIDSATMMNKGLEVIEAHFIFNMPADRIKVIVHPQSIVHSMIEFIDGTVLAQLSHPDMKAPIAYALSCPDRLKDIVAPMSFADIGKLTFEDPDHQTFPSLQLAYQALEAGGLMPAVMNGANEAAVELFLAGDISFTAISETIARVMDVFDGHAEMSLDAVIDADKWAKAQARRIASSFLVADN